MSFLDGLTDGEMAQDDSGNWPEDIFCLYVTESYFSVTTGQRSDTFLLKKINNLHQPNMACWS